MTPPPSTRTLLTIPFAIPAYWTPEQALAVAELLEDLCEFIWAHYGRQFIDELREQHLCDPGGSSGEPPGGNSF
jgi:hypothetical protein